MNISTYTRNPDYTVVNRKLYENCAFDEPCRIYGFPPEDFNDCEKFIEWLKNSNVDCVYSAEATHEEHKGFCVEMEKRIRDFWKKYDGNVYVEFG